MESQISSPFAQQPTLFTSVLSHMKKKHKPSHAFSLKFILILSFHLRIIVHIVSFQVLRPKQSTYLLSVPRLSRSSPASHPFALRNLKGLAKNTDRRAPQHAIFWIFFLLSPSSFQIHSSKPHSPKATNSSCLFYSECDKWRDVPTWCNNCDLLSLSSLYMFPTSICPSSGVLYTGCLLLHVVFSTVKK